MGNQKSELSGKEAIVENITCMSKNVIAQTERYHCIIWGNEKNIYIGMTDRREKQIKFCCTLRDECVRD